MRVLKFLISGMVGISVNLAVFHAVYVLGVQYLTGSVIGFLAAMFVGFTLQKYWTFEDRSRERMHSQFALYGALALGNLVLNTGIVYLLVDKFSVYYLLAQAIGAVVVAIDGFFIYRALIFNSHQGSSGPAGI